LEWFVARRRNPEDDAEILRRFAAALYAIDLAVRIENFPIGHVNAHRWPYTHYALCPWCYKWRKPGHKRCECRS
jgi:hypothetical protein